MLRHVLCFCLFLPESRSTLQCLPQLSQGFVAVFRAQGLYSTRPDELMCLS